MEGEISHIGPEYFTSFINKTSESISHEENQLQK